MNTMNPRPLALTLAVCLAAATLLPPAAAVGARPPSRDVAVVSAERGRVTGDTLILVGAAKQTDAVIAAARRPGGAVAVVRATKAAKHRDAIAVRLSKPTSNASGRVVRFHIDRMTSTAGTALAHLDSMLDRRLDTSRGPLRLDVEWRFGWEQCHVQVTNNTDIDLVYIQATGAGGPDGEDVDGIGEWMIRPPATLPAHQSATWVARSLYDRSCSLTTHMAGAYFEVTLWTSSVAGGSAKCQPPDNFPCAVKVSKIPAIAPYGDDGAYLFQYTINPPEPESAAPPSAS
jgi:hypothetical protein